ncbi:MAG: AbrB/MazE/SpoVT family DNA-binding domain-containing protein [Deltaproteobacteria bacterium]|nr:AbrB/MazE/SpoVT family DNA-binding domain-containing protein [Deltaproteobacteria bacterium]
MKREAALFWNGRSQAVRLPKEMRFDGKKVWIEQVGDTIVLRPFEKQWTEEFWQSLGSAKGELERPVFSEEQTREPFFQ